jgi:Holliday junction DNA helicase RuvA
MYDQICGEVLRKTPTSLVVETHGVGYLLEASLRTTAAVAVGANIRILVHHRPSEDAVRLFGFVDEAERDLFRSLLKVNGVGPAHALALLSAAEPDELWAALRDGVERRLTASKGIGSKIAQRLITELRDEAARRAVKGAVDAAPVREATDDDAIGALVVLGYSEGAAAKAVSAARRKLDKSADVDLLVRTALAEK